MCIIQYLFGVLCILTLITSVGKQPHTYTNSEIYNNSIFTLENKFIGRVQEFHEHCYFPAILFKSENKLWGICDG